MKKVDIEQFYAHFKDRLNVTTGAVGNWPFEWHVKQNGNLIAKSVETLAPKESEEYTITEYFINN